VIAIAIPRQPPQVARPAATDGPSPPYDAPPGPSGCGVDHVWLGDHCLAIAGSKWEMTTEMPTNDTRTFLIEFEPNGRLVSHDPADSTDDDEWEADGTHLRFWFNQRYVVYDANTTSELEMSGTALNVNDLQWPWAARRR
jgi:hypothetical protein